MSDQDFKNRIKAVAFDRLIPGKVYTAEAIACLRADVEFELTNGREVIADPVTQPAAIPIPESLSGLVVLALNVPFDREDGGVFVKVCAKDGDIHRYWVTADPKNSRGVSIVPDINVRDFNRSLSENQRVDLDSLLFRVWASQY